jgi:methionyl-tRNA formyltransferase
MLPKYRGRCPHIWAIINNESKTGVTAHFIDEKCDTGDIIIQKEVSINPKDTGFKLLQKFKKLYPSIVFEIVNLANRNNLYGVKQIEVFSTFFGKRTPEDGCINWNWQKERINNWIRAQASPYPGAFTLFYNTKLIIDKISYTNIGYNFSQPNGLIIQNHPFPLIKTPNGVIQLDSIRFNNSILKPGEILHYEDRNL